MPLFLALPAVFLLFAFHFVPIAAGGYYSLTDWDGIGPANFIGFRNFSDLLSDPTTSGALVNTFKLAGVFFVVVNVVGLALAIALHRTLKSRNFLRALFFAPVVMSPLAVSFIWQYMFQTDGAVNSILGTLGLDSLERPWLGDPTWALWTVLVVMVWQLSGLTMVIYLAGLQSIPDELFEAAAVDGASVWMRFRRIVFPLLAPATTVAATLTLIFGLRVFEQVIALTNGGPVDASETLATQVWKQTFVVGKFGYGAALALILTALIAVLAFVQLAVLRAREARM